jgi:hypothetical protein
VRARSGWQHVASVARAPALDGGQALPGRSPATKMVTPARRRAGHDVSAFCIASGIFASYVTMHADPDLDGAAMLLDLAGDEGDETKQRDTVPDRVSGPAGRVRSAPVRIRRELLPNSHRPKTDMARYCPSRPSQLLIWLRPRPCHPPRGGGRRGDL